MINSANNSTSIAPVGISTIPQRLPEPSDSAPRQVELAQKLIARGFEIDFVVVDCFAGKVVAGATAQPEFDATRWIEQAHGVFRRGAAEFLFDEDPFLVLAIPIPNRRQTPLVAIGVFITSPVKSFDAFSQSARALGFVPEAALRWSADQTPWQPPMLERIAALVSERLETEVRKEKAEFEVEELSSNLINSYEEISLLYSLTQNLKLTRDDTDFCRVVLERLADVLPAQGIAIYLQSVADETTCHEARTSATLLSHNEFPIQQSEFERFVAALGRKAKNEPIVLNRSVTSADDWPYPEVREVVSTPLMEGRKMLGWIVAVNHVDDHEFGTVEASLISSVAAILGIHCGNTDLYRQQADFLAGVVRALTAAIDAKDPYTCGHSDRVARIAVRLAEEMGCSPETLNTVYLSGLLHDIGKIGIDDSVLRKPGKLTEAEFEHIKMHPELGYKILADLRQFGQVLPVVLHHHEAWNGTGYPHGLSGTSIPLLARIVAVADSFDAMSSDRPYRNGMPIDRIEEILRTGAGVQWDTRVIDAYFASRDDIVPMVNQERETLQVESLQWN
ncbi:MAG: HD domain-containing protein [Planctomycetales bacterium]|nr:HD domain-containing protein [Planctomycetales bacterium]